MPLAIMRCESRMMMQDWVRAIRETLMFEPRYIRHLISSIRIRPEGDGMVSVIMNYVLETLMDEMTKVLNAGRYVTSSFEDGELRFKEKRCVYDLSVVLNSLVYPVQLPTCTEDTSERRAAMTLGATPLLVRGLSGEGRFSLLVLSALSHLNRHRLRGWSPISLSAHTSTSSCLARIPRGSAQFQR